MIPFFFLESVNSTKVVTSMKYSIDPTFLLESVDSTKVVMLMLFFSYPTLMMGSDVSTNLIFSISISILLEQGGILLTLRTPPPSPRMVSFHWNVLVEPRLPSYIPFQIRVEVNSKKNYCCI